MRYEGSLAYTPNPIFVYIGCCCVESDFCAAEHGLLTGLDDELTVDRVRSLLDPVYLVMGLVQAATDLDSLIQNQFHRAAVVRSPDCALLKAAVAKQRFEFPPVS